MGMIHPDQISIGICIRMNRLDHIVIGIVCMVTLFLFKSKVLNISFPLDSFGVGD